MNVEGRRDFAELGVSKAVVHALVEYGISCPNDLQVAALPALFLQSLRAVEVRSSAGRGKTTTALIGVLELLRRRRRRVFEAEVFVRCWALCPTTHPLRGVPRDVAKFIVRWILSGHRPRVAFVVPHRELADSTFATLVELGKFLDPPLRAFKLAGPFKQEPHVLANVDVVCATPGRLAELARKGLSTPLASFSLLVCDEADELLSNGAQNPLMRIHAAMNSPHGWVLSTTPDVSLYWEKLFGAPPTLIRQATRVY